MTHSLELSPKGIYKQNDENPKVIEPEEEIKIPDFSELSTLEGWVHKNPMILNVMNLYIFSWEDAHILLIHHYLRNNLRLLLMNLLKKILKFRD